MPKVLIVAAADLSPELGRTVLWRYDVERIAALTMEVGLEAARALVPSLIVLDGASPEASLALIRRLRQDPATRAMSIAVLSRAYTLAEDEALRQAGANLVLPGQVDPLLWDARLEELLNVARRREARFPVRLRRWSRFTPDEAPAEGLGLNISSTGILLEGARRLGVGTKHDIAFGLPGRATELQVVGQVVWEGASREGRVRSGIKFAILRGEAREEIRAFVESEPAQHGLGGADAGAAPGLADLPERSQWENELRASEALKAAILESALDAIVTVDQEGVVVEFNRAAERTFGYDRAEVVGRRVTETIVPPSLREACHRALASSLDAGEGSLLGTRFETTGIRKDGSEFPAELAVAPIERGRRLFTGYLRDITDRKRAEEALRASEQRYRQLFERNLAGVYRSSADGRVLECNDACARILGYSREELLAHDARDDYLDPADREALVARLREQGSLTNVELRLRRKDGSLVWVLENLSLLEGGPGEPAVIEGTLIDISERKRVEEEIHHQAYHDALTGLPNRALFSDRLGVLIARARRQGHTLAVLYLDLDHFKLVNDTLGHGLGDRLLQEVAGRLVAGLRQEDTIARVGGDEFLVLLPQTQQAEAVARVAEKILLLAEEPLELDGHALHLTASIGISLFPTDGEDPQTLLRNADTAMYRAKEQGRNAYQLFTAEMNARVVRRISLEQKLRRALEREEFVLRYQPQLHIERGRIVGFEALLRWEDPGAGEVQPNDFIALAEETGLIVPIGEWVLRNACRQARLWRDQGFPALRVAVNISARQFRQRDLTRTIERALAEAGLDVRDLELEITESAAMEDVERAVGLLRTLREMGLRIAFDDFGTGYASLSYLKRFPIHSLKIDQYFVGDLASASGTAIVKAIIQMAHGLGLSVIAEGVETEDQLGLLRQWGCDECQGYLYGRPVLAPAVPELLVRNGR